MVVPAPPGAALLPRAHAARAHAQAAADPLPQRPEDGVLDALENDQSQDHPRQRPAQRGGQAPPGARAAAAAAGRPPAARRCASRCARFHQLCPRAGQRAAQRQQHAVLSPSKATRASTTPTTGHVNEDPTDRAKQPGAMPAAAFLPFPPRTHYSLRIHAVPPGLVLQGHHGGDQLSGTECAYITTHFRYCINDHETDSGGTDPTERLHAAAQARGQRA